MPSVGLILTVGMEPAPLEFSISEYDPEYVVFIGTMKSLNRVIDEVVSDLALLPSKYEKITVEDNAKEIGKFCREFQRAIIVLKEHGIDTIVCDPTGGRKWMSAGAVMVASAANLEMIYVHVDYEKNKPVPKSMRIVRLGNAYDQTGFIQAERARAAFNAYNFDGAAKSFQEIVPSNSSKNELFRGLEKVCDVLAKWDRFEHYKEQTQSNGLEELTFNLREAIEQIERSLHDEYLEAFQGFLKGLNDVLSWYEQMIQEGGLNEKIFFIVDIFMNAVRRVQRARFDDAVARFYRALEASSQYLLSSEYGIDSYKLKKTDLEEAQLKTFLALLPGEVSELPEKISLVDSFLLLNVLGHPVAKIVFKDPSVDNETTDRKKLTKSFVFQAVLNYRNSSILAHGFKAVTKENCDKFKFLLEEYLFPGMFGDEFKEMCDALEIPELPKMGF